MPVGYVYSPHLIRYADCLPSNKNRASKVHTLIKSFGLLDHDQLDIIPCSPASAFLETFHDRDYLDCIYRASERESDREHAIGPENTASAVVSSSDSSSPSSPASLSDYGLEYDCPAFPALWDYVSWLAGATLQCVDYIAQTKGVAINWTGGRHHAFRSRASGFCYVNDAVLAIQRLRKTYAKVMYIDLDIHHGDGVEAAFRRSNSVLCASIHRYDPGFFPGTGRAEGYASQEQQDEGVHTENQPALRQTADLQPSSLMPANSTTINIPTKPHLSDAGLIYLFNRIIVPAKHAFCPDAVVVNCGCDGLARDKYDWNLTVRGYGSVVDAILAWELPTLLLGGGGYHGTDTPRCWTYLTACALNVKERHQWSDIPGDHPYIVDFADDAYKFHIPAHKHLKDPHMPQPK